MDLMDKFYSRAKLVHEEMERSIPRDAEPFEVYGLIWEFLDRGGKCFRPLFCLSSASAACHGKMLEEEAVKRALPAAAAIELFHNFTLIHDDIEDQSEMRRGKPCLHIQYGLPIALNAGDGLFMTVWKTAQRIHPEYRDKSHDWLLCAFTSVLEGQAIELSWHRNNKFDLKEEDYMKMAAGKTAALVQVAAKVGTYLGGGTEEQVGKMASFGHLIGISFQIQDDILNLVGEESKYKKEIGGDVREGKRTLISLHALSNLPAADSQKLREILAAKQNTKQEISWAIEKMHAAGSIEYARKKAKMFVNDAISSLYSLPKSTARDELEQIARYIVSRQR